MFKLSYMSMSLRRVRAVCARWEPYLSKPLRIKMVNFDSEQPALMPDFVDFCENEQDDSLRLPTVAFIDTEVSFLDALRLAARTVALSGALTL